MRGPTIPSATEAPALLERLDRRLGARPEDAVDGHGLAAGAQELLERSDGEAVAGTPHERPRLDWIGRHEPLLGSNDGLCNVAAIRS